jgi:hypothetical protein
MRRALALPRPPGWLVGWWAAGRALAIAIPVSLHGSFSALSGWDGHWYLRVARFGYLLVPGHQSDPAFFPLYPIVVRVFHFAGLPWTVAGPVISNLALLAGLALFLALTRELFDDEIARRATIYLAIFPLGYVFSMTYPESVVLVLIAAAPLAAMRGRWWIAALCAAAAALARPEALFVALPLAGIAWQQRTTLTPARRGTAIAAILAPAVALGSFSLYLDTVLHDPFAWSRAEHAWGRSFQPTGPLRAFAHIPQTFTQSPWLVRDVLAFFLYLGLLYSAWKLGTPRTWLAAAAAIVVLPIFSGVFDSIARFGLLAPPLFWGLAALGRTPARDRAVRALSLVLLALGALSLAWIYP